MLSNAETDESSAQTIISGECGPDAKYALYSGGMLQITGYGEMYQYDSTPAPWYDYHDEITEIFICVNITKLGASAFKDCTHLTHLTIPIALNSVTSDKYPAFEGCSSIYRINLTCGHGSDGEYGYNYAAYPISNSWYQNTPWYQSKDSLNILCFENGIKGIGSDAFRELNITSIVLPDSVVHLGNHCFFNCTKLTDLTISVSLNPYGGDENYPAFRGCIAIQKVTFTRGNGVPFDYTTWWWESGSKLTPWNMYPEVTKTIIISDDVSSLGEDMFLDCNVKELIVPISVNLQYGNFHEGIAAFDPSHRYNNLEKVTITKGSGKICDYNVSKWYGCPWYNAPNLKTVIFEEGITRIGENQLYKCSFENLILPNSLTALPEFAFKNCTFKNLTIPISVNAAGSVYHPAFRNVSGIENITITPGSGYGFNYAAYEGTNGWYQYTPWYQCRSTLTSIVFEEGIKSIGSDAFRELNLTSIVIPNSVCSLSNHTFYQCSMLTELTIPISLDSVASAKYPAFDCCDLKVVDFTSGTNGAGFNYSEGYYPPWANVNGTSVTKTTFDKDIIYIGKETVHGYTFYGESGEIEPWGYNLSGRTFEGADGQMWEIQDGADSISTLELSSTLNEAQVFVKGLNSAEVTSCILKSHPIIR